MKENTKKIRFLGSLWGRGAGFAGAVWSKNRVSPTLTTMQGGGREPHIVVKNDSNTNMEKSDSSK